MKYLCIFPLYAQVFLFNTLKKLEKILIPKAIMYFL